MSLKVVESASKITSDTTATVVVESDLRDGKAHYELELKGWETARDWATCALPICEEIGTEQYNLPPESPERQATAYRIDVTVHGRMR